MKVHSNPSRSTAAAVYLFIANLVAVGLGPFITGWLIDHLVAHNYALALASDLHAAGRIAADSVRTACPGGVAPKGSSAEMVTRCALVLNHSSRQALTITYAAVIGSGLFYLQCARDPQGIGKASRCS